MIHLSVIIPTRNRAHLLEGALQSISTQSFPKEQFEVIVVDNGSTDDTKPVVERFRDKLNLQYHYDSHPGLHTGRHAGMHLANGDILVYADDDIEAFPSWLEAIHDSFRDPDVVLVGGKDLPKYECQPPFWILEKWYDLCDYGHCMPELSLIDFGDSAKAIPPEYVFGCNFSVRKKILAETKGFHPDGMPFEMIHLRGDGETYVSRYIASHDMKAVYNPKASVYHKVPQSRLTLDYFKKRAFCQGVETSYADKRYASPTPPVTKRKNRLRRWINIFCGVEAVRLLKQWAAKPQKTDIEKQIESSFAIGYRYHDVLYHSDATLREWVHRDNYLEAQ